MTVSQGNANKHFLSASGESCDLPQTEAEDSVLAAAGEEPARIGPLYTPAQPITAVTPPSESLLIMAVSEEGYVWQWDMPLQVGGPSVFRMLRNYNHASGICVILSSAWTVLLANAHHHADASSRGSICMLVAGVLRKNRKPESATLGVHTQPMMVLLSHAQSAVEAAPSSYIRKPLTCYWR